MPDDGSRSLSVRVPVAVLLVAALAGVLVGAGTIEPDPATNTFPDETDVATSSGDHVGQRVSVAGTVVETDPVVVRVEYGLDEHARITVLNVEEPVSEGDSIAAFGTLTDERTVDAERTLVRAPWETWYMYGVSFLGGLWVLWRLGRQWRVDRELLALVPRGGRDA